ncbi:hypothetical protein F4813DRAFT_345695 [Daldinia decipiens]|uniref:uncharacterized protein n=1 Tax=Daldinia decipiens TaxID=326647 RepID=UPI0020C37968|nr:uncharacterized protein F4813DRAFT_345695 [Daldinia decipiens]KAI1661770.1 hypothetical protein F4813DRAFT_345695 [Daldinia decipiens]
MAALTPAQIELANSLTPAELPTKLRCAVCSKLAVNAFKLPCCETAICEKCQSTLPSVCPVCEHSPVSASDCTFYKSLRTTIRVFLKTEEKKREAARPKANGSTPTTPAQDTPTPTQTRTPTEQPPANNVADGQAGLEPKATDSVPPSGAADSEGPSAAELKPDVDAQPKEDEPSSGLTQEQPTGDDESEAVVPHDQGGQDGAAVEDIQEADQGGDGKDQLAQSGMGSSFESMNGNFNMNFGNGDLNQMQMMMAMQNGMNPSAFGSFPMMGMMDPMAMQNMMMNSGFGAQGIGMNGMNMNMGMNGFNGGGNDWNGQQSWNVGQDNFNPNAPGMGNGDFGNFNAGFRTGFNSGNFGHHNQFNDYRRGNYGYRGRGRGRGFYGGYGRGYHQGYNNGNQGWAGQAPQYPGDRDDSTVQDVSQVTEQTPGSVDEFGRALRAEPCQDTQTAGENGDAETGNSHDNVATNGTDKLTLANFEVTKEDGSQSAQGDVSVSSKDQHSAPQGPRGNAGPLRLQTSVPDIPLNAPTGPKAMRQGLPNTSLLNLRARGLITDEKSPSSRTNHPPIVASPVEDKHKSRSSSLQSSKDKERRHRERDREHDEEEKSREHRRDRDRDRSRTYTGSKSRSRSRSRDRKDSRKHRRHRSPSISEDDRDGGHRRRKHKSRKQSTRGDDDYRGRSRDGKHDERSRSASPVDREHRRPSHRSRRDRDEKRRDHDVEKDSDYDRNRKSNHRSHRDRDQDRERDREREKERDKDRGKDRGRNHEEDRGHRSNKNSTALPTPIEPSDKSFNPPTGPRGNFSIKGASNKQVSVPDIKGSSSKPSNSSRRETGSSRRASHSSAAVQKPSSGATSKDPHTLEREARDRERLLKEAQRMATIGRTTGVKRSRDGGDDRSSRRKSRRSEAVNTEDEEGRMRRLEAEREGRRWD